MILIAALAWLSDRPAEAKEYELVHGVALYPWSKQIEENRFRSPGNWELTYRHFKKRFKGLDWVQYEEIANLPNVRAVHISSSNPKTGWEFINLYRVGGEVRYFIYPRQKAEAESEKAAEKKKETKGKDPTPAAKETSP